MRLSIRNINRKIPDNSLLWIVNLPITLLRLKAMIMRNWYKRELNMKERNILMEVSIKLKTDKLLNHHVKCLHRFPMISLSNLLIDKLQNLNSHQAIKRVKEVEPQVTSEELGLRLSKLFDLLLIHTRFTKALLVEVIILKLPFSISTV